MEFLDALPPTVLIFAAVNRQAARADDDHLPTTKNIFERPFAYNRKLPRRSWRDWWRRNNSPVVIIARRRSGPRAAPDLLRSVILLARIIEIAGVVHEVVNERSEERRVG